MANEIQELIQKSVEISKMIYPNGDNHYARKTKSGSWIFGYINDSILQHGNGESTVLPEEFCLKLLRSLTGCRECVSDRFNRG